MLRKFLVALVVALGFAGASLTLGSAQAAVVQPGAGGAIAQGATPSAATPAYYRRGYGYRRYGYGYRGYGYRGYGYRPYYRPYYGYRPYTYGSYYGGGCRVVSRRVWTAYGYRWVRRRICY
jgi:hypothetical protein